MHNKIIYVYLVGTQDIMIFFLLTNYNTNVMHKHSLVFLLTNFLNFVGNVIDAMPLFIHILINHKN